MKTKHTQVIIQVTMAIVIWNFRIYSYPKNYTNRYTNIFVLELNIDSLKL